MRRKRGIKGSLTKLGVLCLALLLGMGSLTVGYAAWTDTLTIGGTVNTGSWGSGETPGFWKNWDSHNTYTEEEIEGWLGVIDTESVWLGPTTVGGMVVVFDTGEPDEAPMEQKFLRQYLATRLNVAAGGLSLGTTHNFSDPDDYLGLGGEGDLQLIIDRIEGKYGTADVQFETMKNICDFLNHQES